MDEQNKHSAAPAPSESGKPAETSKRRRSHLPVVHVAEKKPRGPVFDTHYFLTALTHMFVALAALGFAVYMIVQLVGDLTPTVTTSPATLTSESESEAATAYVIRDEKVITSGASGSLLYTVPDGARVASGEVAIFVYPASDEEKNRRLEEIAAEKALLEYALAESGAAENIHDVNSELNSEYSSLTLAAARLDYGSAASTSNDMRRLLIRYDAYRGKKNEITARLTELNNEKSRLESLRGNITEKIRAPYSGYFFRYCDGYEQSFSELLANGFSSAGFYAAVDSQPFIATGTVGKLISSPKWYIAVSLSEKNGNSYIEGNIYNVRFEDNSSATIPMTLEKKVADEKTGGILLLFSTDRMVSGFSYKRIQSVSIERSVLTGYRVPMSAVRSYRGMVGVYTLHGGRVYFRRINILYQNEDYCIVSEYSAVSGDRGLTYKVLGFNADGILGEYDSLHRFAQSRGWDRHIYDNGGTPVKYGTKEDYYYYLDELEDIILTGKNLYDGKTLG